MLEKLLIIKKKKKPTQKNPNQNTTNEQTQPHNYTHFCTAVQVQSYIYWQSTKRLSRHPNIKKVTSKKIRAFV